MKSIFPLSSTFVVLVLTGFVGGSVLAAGGKRPAQTPGGLAEPIRYIGNAHVNPLREDGGLPWAVGVQSYQVLRAARLYPSISDGHVEIANGSRVVRVTTYTAGKWLAFKIDYNAARKQFSVAMDGRLILQDADFAVPVNALQRISFRIGPYRGARIDQSGSGGRDKCYYVGHIDPRTDRPLKDPAVYYLDDVSSQSK